MRKVMRWDAIESEGVALKLYHRTSRRGADAILKRGFADATTHFGGIEVSGVWLSNYPVDANEGAKGAVLLRVVLTIEVHRLAVWEIVNDGGTYREWCIPAGELNENARTVEIADDDPELPEVRFPKAWLK